MSYFLNREEVDTVSEPVWCAENNGDSLEVQFWARRVRPGPWMSILGIFWQFPWFFPHFLSLFKYKRPYIVGTNEKQCYLYFENYGERLKAQFWILEGPWMSMKANFGDFFGRFWPILTIFSSSLLIYRANAVSTVKKITFSCPYYPDHANLSCLFSEPEAPFFKPEVKPIHGKLPFLHNFS